MNSRQVLSEAYKKREILESVQLNNKPFFTKRHHLVQTQQRQQSKVVCDPFLNKMRPQTNQNCRQKRQRSLHRENSSTRMNQKVPSLSNLSGGNLLSTEDSDTSLVVSGSSNGLFSRQLYISRSPRQGQQSQMRKTMFESQANYISTAAAATRVNTPKSTPRRTFQI